MQEIITIQISNYLTNELAEKIARAQWNSDSPVWVNRIRRAIYDEDAFNACFDVIATDAGGAVIGRLHCIQNEHDPSLWYYGDLFVVSSCRRRGIASQMVTAAKNHLSGMGAKTLRCYVEPQNLPSIRLQTSLGFLEKPFAPFNGLINDGEIMFECDIPNPLTVTPATSHEAYFVGTLFLQNRAALHADPISLPEWEAFLSMEDPDEIHFLICKGAMPVAYLKINGLLNADMAWISTLFVAPKYHRRGIGTYAIRFAEDFIKNKGFSKVAIQTTVDNTPAQNLYTKCGYLGAQDPQTQNWIYTKPLK